MSEPMPGRCRIGRGNPWTRCVFTLEGARPEYSERAQWYLDADLWTYDWPPPVWISETTVEIAFGADVVLTGKAFVYSISYGPGSHAGIRVNGAGPLRLAVPCPHDTNGDGDCGRPLCPNCGNGR